MTYAKPLIDDGFDAVTRMPKWVEKVPAKTLEDAGFASGAALSHLHGVLDTAAVPQGLLRARLALRAAEACVKHTGRPERSQDLRDAVAFLQPGDHPGPAGVQYLAWQQAVARPISAATLQKALSRVDAFVLTHVLEAPGAPPMTRAAQVLETAIAAAPRKGTAGLILADAALAQAFGWSHIFPVLGCRLKLADVRKTGDALLLACHHAARISAIEATRLAADLARRGAKLEGVAPKLRAKGSDDAVALFLSRDAVTPKDLTALRSSRSARRFCDRLVSLGVVRELTGRESFRLYGV